MYCPNWALHYIFTVLLSCLIVCKPMIHSIKNAEVEALEIFDGNGVNYVQGVGPTEKDLSSKLENPQKNTSHISIYTVS